jgi:hypothetical protein
VEVDGPPAKLQKISLVQEVIQPRVIYTNRQKAVSRQSRLEHLSEEKKIVKQLRSEHFRKEKKDVRTNLRENICVLGQQISEQKANINYERNLEGMLEEPRL